MFGEEMTMYTVRAPYYMGLTWNLILNMHDELPKEQRAEFNREVLRAASEIRKRLSGA